MAYLGMQPCSITMCVRDRAAVFVTPAVVRPIADTLLTIAANQRCNVVVYCVMPDHLHVLAAGTSDESDVRELVRIFKQKTSYEWKRRHGLELWQRGYIDRILRADEDTLTVARYISKIPCGPDSWRRRSNIRFQDRGRWICADVLESVRRT